MAWDLDDAGSWGVATTDNPAADMPAALALPGSWNHHPGGNTLLVRKDQWADFNKLSAVDADFEDGTVGTFGGAYQATLSNTTAQAHTGQPQPAGHGHGRHWRLFRLHHLLPGTGRPRDTAQAWVKPSATGRQAAITVAWYDAGHGYVAQVPGVYTTLSSSAWTYVANSDCVAPPGAAYLQISPGFGGGASGNLFDWDSFVVL